MTQKISFGSLGATGIIGVLFIIGIILKITNVSPILGDLAIGSSIFIGIVYAVLGIFGILERL